MSTAPTATAPVTEKSHGSTSPVVKKKRGLSSVPTHVFLIVVCLVWIIPLLGMLVSSLAPNAFSVNNGWWTALIRSPLNFDNYVNAFTQNDLVPKFFATVAIAVPSTLIGVLLSAVAAFVLSFMNLPGRKAILLLVTALMVIPPQIVLSPLLRMVHAVGLDGSVSAVWIYQLGLSVPFGIVVLTSAFEAVPRELVEAASIDGASNFATFVRVVVPMTRGSIAGVGVIFFLWGWNELLGPLIFIGAQGDSSPLTTTIASLAQGESQDQNLILAAAALSIVVPTIVFLALQRFFVRGVLGGAVKG